MINTLKTIHTIMQKDLCHTIKRLTTYILQLARILAYQCKGGHKWYWIVMVEVVLKVLVAAAAVVVIVVVVAPAVVVVTIICCDNITIRTI